MKKYVSAIDEFHRAMVIHDDVGDRWSAARTMTCLGIALHAIGAAAAAVDQWQKALAICKDLNDSSAAERIRTLLESQTPPQNRGAIGSSKPSTH